MSKIWWNIFDGRFLCCKQALLLLENPPAKDWHLSNPYLWGQHLVWAINMTLYVSFVQKHSLNRKAGIVQVLLIGTSVKRNTMQTELELLKN